MVKDEQNRLLTRVGPDAPMGRAMRRFWLPFMQAKDLESGGAPRKIDLLGEQLLAFRSPDGKLGLIDRFCAHRGVDLFFARNEDCGLRCIFHGWKYDHSGQCIDVPNVPEGARIKDKIRIKSYPVTESGGMLWTCMNRDGSVARFSGAPWTHHGEVDGHWAIGQIECEGNYLQHLEGLADDNHVSFLHLDMSSGGGGEGLYEDSPAFQDTSPTWGICEPADFGAMLGWVRKAGADKSNLRLNIFILPCMVAVASPRPADFETWQYCVPLSDNRTMFYLVISRRDRPVPEGEKRLFTDPQLFFFPPLIPGSYKPAIGREQDYAIDRAAQRNRYFSGIRYFRLQDMATQEYVRGGLIADRSMETLVASDKGVSVCRKRLLDLATKESEGKKLDEPAVVASRVFTPLDVDVSPTTDMRSYSWEHAVETAHPVEA